MTTIREKSTAALAEALHHLGIACSPFRGSVVVSPSGASPLDRVVLSCETGYHRPAAEALAASPTLARRLDFATAWDEAVAAAEAAITEDIRIEGEAAGIVGVVPYSFGDHAYVAQTYPPVPFASAYSESPTDALVALTEALREAQR